MQLLPHPRDRQDVRVGQQSEVGRRHRPHVGPEDEGRREDGIERELRARKRVGDGVGPAGCAGRVSSSQARVLQGETRAPEEELVGVVPVAGPCPLPEHVRVVAEVLKDPLHVARLQRGRFRRVGEPGRYTDLPTDSKPEAITSTLTDTYRGPHVDVVAPEVASVADHRPERFLGLVRAEVGRPGA